MSAKRLTGINPLAYLGVEATTPPALVVEQRDPTGNDYQGYDLGTLWLTTGVTKLSLLVSKDPGDANKWVEVYPAAGSGANFFQTDSGTAVEVSGYMMMLGSSNGISTSGSANIVRIGLKDDLVAVNSLTVSTMSEGIVVSDSVGLLSSIPTGTDLQVLAGNTGAAPTFYTLVSEDGSVTIALGSLAGTINLEATGGGGGGNFAGLTDTAGATATPSGDKVKIAGYVDTYSWSNITTTASGHTITLKLADMINLPATDFSDPAHPKGIYSIGGKGILHTLGSQNVFLGQNVASSTDFNEVSAENNVGIGFDALKDLETSADNVSIGKDSLLALQAGSGGNVCIGSEVASGLINGHENVILGHGSASNFDGSESNNIIISNPGTSGMDNTIMLGDDNYHEDCYIGGIYGSSGLVSTNGVVLIDDNAKLVSSKGTTGQVLTATATGAAWAAIPTPSGSQSSYAFYVNQSYTLSVGTKIILGEDHILVPGFSDPVVFYGGGGVGGDPATFTAAKAGYYWFVEQDYSSGYVPGWTLTLNKVDSKYWTMQSVRSGSGSITTTNEYMVYLALGEVLKFYYQINPVSFPPYSGTVYMYMYYLGS